MRATCRYPIARAHGAPASGHDPGGPPAATYRGGAILPAALAAFASACGFAISTSVQHRAASSAPASSTSAIKLLRYLVRNPLWLLGITVGGIAFAFHALALSLGVIALVQPIMVSGVVLAILARSAMDRRRPSAREVKAVTVTSIGLMAFLVVASTKPNDQPPDRMSAATMVGIGVVVAVILGSIALRVSGAKARGLLLGAGAGVLFGLTAGLLKLVTSDLAATSGLIDGLVSWPVPVLAGAGLFGMALNQRAYQVAPLSVSMPLLNVIDVLVAIGFGLVVFGEAPASNAVAVMIQAAALLCMGAGLMQIARLHDSDGVPTQPPRGMVRTRSEQ